jgi:tubulin polyglutamylase TTLL6/13
MYDLAITPDILCKIKPYQRISQFPGILVIANKSKLGRNLNKMQKFYPDEYDFFP